MGWAAIGKLGQREAEPRSERTGGSPGARGPGARSVQVGPGPGDRARDARERSRSPGPGPDEWASWGGEAAHGRAGGRGRENLQSRMVKITACPS